MAQVDGQDYPEARWYDVENQVWYEPLAGNALRAGMTPVSISLAGEIYVFTPRRNGLAFEKGRSFALIEGGKWVGAVRAAFDGVVVASNEDLIQRPSLLGRDAFGKGWMLVVRPATPDWRAGLVTGAAVGLAFGNWLEAGTYKDRTD